MPLVFFFNTRTDNTLCDVKADRTTLGKKKEQDESKSFWREKRRKRLIRNILRKHHHTYTTKLY
jgi:hypothetical protein